MFLFKIGIFIYEKVLSPNEIQSLPQSRIENKFLPQDITNFSGVDNLFPCHGIVSQPM